MEINSHNIEPQKFVDKWTNWALEATPATDEQVIANVRTMYKKAGLIEPKVHVYRNYEAFLKIDWDSVRDSVGDSVGDSVWDSVWASVWASVRDSVGDSVWAPVGDSVWAPVRDSVRDSVWASVRDSVRDSVGASVGAWNWADDLAFVDVFVATGVLSAKKAAQLEEFKQLLETQRLAVVTKEVAYVLVAPIIRRDNSGRLHSDQRPAVEWENETGLYYLDGVNLTKELWLKILSQQMSFAEIMKIELSDQRTVALKYNPQTILNENAELVDASRRGNELFRIENQKINKELDFKTIWFLRMKCPTGRVFIEGVPPEAAEALPKADAMQALLCGLTYEQYQEMRLES